MKNKNGSSSAKIRQESRTGDIGNANERGIPSYVATPSGSLKRYDPQSGKITVISNNLPSGVNDPQRMNVISSIEKDKETLTDDLIMQSNIWRGIFNYNYK